MDSAEQEKHGRIWVDGCFDFFHHGHAGALQQARALGNELYVGIHTDAEILKNKGPVVMHLDERDYAVNACRWTTHVVSGAPYVTDPAVMDKNGCTYVAHGDDITTDADGHDTYQEVKDMGRFLEFKRTPNISTTDLIARMLSTSKQHHADVAPEFLRSAEALRRFRMYATNAHAHGPYAGVWLWDEQTAVKTHAAVLETLVPPAKEVPHAAVYAEGTFDLFHCGHIEFLSRAKAAAGPDRALIVGLWSDDAVNAMRGSNNPIMNVFERALCVLQCKYVDGVIVNAPSHASGRDVVEVLRHEAGLSIGSVVVGPTPTPGRLAEWAKENGVLETVAPGKYANLRTETIVERVLSNRAEYEARQRRKGVKSSGERVLEEKEREERSRATPASNGQ